MLLTKLFWTGKWNCYDDQLSKELRKFGDQVVTIN